MKPCCIEINLRYPSIIIGQSSTAKTILISCTIKTEVCTQPESCFSPGIDKLLMVPGSTNTISHDGHRHETLCYMLIEVGAQNEFPTWVQ